MLVAVTFKEQFLGPYCCFCIMVVNNPFGNSEFHEDSKTIYNGIWA